MAEVTTNGGPRTAENDGRLQRSQSTRKALLEAASEVFLDRGYRDTTVDAITRRASVAHGTFYSHFKGKEDVFIHVLDEVTEAYYAVLERDPYQPASLADLRSIIRKQIYSIFQLALQWRPILKVLRQAMGESAIIRAFWEDGVTERLFKRGEDDIHYSQAHGLYRQLDARLVSKAVVTLGTSFMWQLIVGSEPAERAEFIADTITDLYLNGIYCGPIPKV